MTIDLIDLILMFAAVACVCACMICIGSLLPEREPLTLDEQADRTW